MSVQIIQPDTWQAKLGKAKTIFDEVKTLLEDPATPAEKKAHIPQMIADAKSLQGEAKTLKEILDSTKDLVLADLADAAGKHRQDDREVKVDGGQRFGRWGEYLYEVWSAGHPGIKEPRDRRLVYFKDEEVVSIEKGGRKDLTGASGSSGGYLIPTEFQATLMSAMGESALIRPRATVIPMRRRQLQIPVLDQTSSTPGYPHWFGGLRFYWAEEGSEKTASDATFRQVDLVAHKLIGFTRASDELLDDSAISLEAFFNGPLGFAGGAAWMEDYAFLRGTGGGMPLGVVNAGATIAVTRQTAGTVGYIDLANMLESFLPSGRGAWFISQSLMSDLIQMNGPSGNAVYLWAGAFQAGGIANRIPGTLLGYPVIWTEKLPRAGYKGDIVLADMSYYLIGDRQATTVESTKFEKWVEDKTSWRMVHRVDGQPWLSAPLTYDDGETQVSPFVQLTGTAGS